MKEAVITIQARGQLYTPVIADEILLERGRIGTPAKLTFRVLVDEVILFWEGDLVTLRMGERILFSGFVFSKRRQAGSPITVVAYDQLRYLKNRDSYSYENLTATGLIRRIAADTGLVLGDLAETEYVLEPRVENGRSLFDMIQTTLDLTEQRTGELFVLYDEAGQLRLSHVRQLLLDTLVYSGSAADFDYTSSIDRGVYTAVKLERANGAEEEPTVYRAMDDDLVRRWGWLQLTGRVGDDEDGAEAAKTLLKLHARKARRVVVTDAAGDLRVMGGSLLPVRLDLGDVFVDELLIVDFVRHRISENGHVMDLTLSGGEIVA